MEPIQDFASLISRLRSLKERKRVVVVCPNDPHTEYVITRSLHEGFADFLLVADTPHLLNSEYIRMQYPDHVKVYEATSPDKAAQEAVSLIRATLFTICLSKLRRVIFIYSPHIPNFYQLHFIFDFIHVII